MTHTKAETSAMVTRLVTLPRPSPWTAGWSAFTTLFVSSIARCLGSKRLLVLSGLFLLPSVICILARIYDPGASEGRPDWFFEGEFGVILIFLPTVLTPLASLIYSSGMIQDEIEEQTLTYLFMRPISRWMIYVAKWLAVVLVAIAMVAFFTFVTYTALFAGTPMYLGDIMPTRVAKTASLLALSVVTYTAFFGLLSLLFKRSLILGVVYIILLEGILATIPFVVRQITVAYHFRVLAVRLLNVDPADWGIDMDVAPDSSTSILMMLGASAFAVACAAIITNTREFRMKTPAGN